MGATDTGEKIGSPLLCGLRKKSESEHGEKPEYFIPFFHTGKSQGGWTANSDNSMP